MKQVENLTRQIAHNNNINDNSNLSNIELYHLKERMKFPYTFDGKNIGDTQFIIFRNKAMNWYNQTKLLKGWNEDHAVSILKAALTEDASNKINEFAGQNVHTVQDWFNWFDKEYNIAKIRTDLYNELKNWAIKPNTPVLNIVDNYEAQYKLLKQSGELAPAEVCTNTEITQSDMVKYVVAALPAKIESEFDFVLSITPIAPTNLNELRELLSQVYRNLMVKQSIKPKKKYQDPTDMGQVNNINRINTNNTGRNAAYYDTRNFRQTNYRGRGRGRGRERGNFNKRNFDPNVPPLFIPFTKCNSCGLWGHVARTHNVFERKFKETMHHYNKLQIRLFDKNKSKNNSNNNSNKESNQVNATQTKTKPK